MKKIIAALCAAGAVIMIASGCARANSETTKQDKIGIIGAMDTEVTTLKDSAQIKRRPLSLEWNFAREHLAAKTS